MTSKNPTAGDAIAGRYVLEQPLGEGGIGAVWTAWQTGVERKVAVKFLKGQFDEAHQQRFKLEAQALGRLNHPNCITVHDFGHSPSHAAYYLVMEHVDGRPLSVWRGRRIPIGDIVQVARQISTALAYAHHQGVAHRDLKPENVMLVTTFDGAVSVKVLDFGLARLGSDPDDDHRLTRTGEIFGTPAYMSPEQIQSARHAGSLSDLYSLGVMLYEMVEDRLPFWEDTSFQLLTAHVQKPVPPMERPDRPDELEALILRLLAKSPHGRPQSALEVYDILGTIKAPSYDSEDTLKFVVSESPHETLASIPRAHAATIDESTTLVTPGPPVFEIEPTRAPEPAQPGPVARVDVSAEVDRATEPPTPPATRFGLLAAIVISALVLGGAVIVSSIQSRKAREGHETDPAEVAEDPAQPSNHKPSAEAETVADAGTDGNARAPEGGHAATAAGTAASEPAESPPPRKPPKRKTRPEPKTANEVGDKTKESAVSSTEDTKPPPTRVENSDALKLKDDDFR